MIKQSLVRDFIYLDVERIRSFVAQVKEGLISERSFGSEHEAASKGTIEGSLPLIAKASGEVDYHYLRSKSETKSLHDFIFEEFFRSLESEGSLLDVSSKTGFVWVENAFLDGHFVLSTGVFKFIDYQHTMEIMNAGVNTFKIARKSITGTGAEKQKKESELQRQMTEYKKIPLDELTEFVNTFYTEDIVRVSIYPFAGNTTSIFTGNAERSLFRYPPVSLRNTYGSVVDAGWRCLLQVNKGIRHAPGELIGKTGNQLEDAFEQLVETTATLSNLTHGITFPAVAMTPIAIYREV